MYGPPPHYFDLWIVPRTSPFLAYRRRGNDAEKLAVKCRNWPRPPLALTAILLLSANESTECSGFSESQDEQLSIWGMVLRTVINNNNAQRLYAACAQRRGP